MTSRCTFSGLTGGRLAMTMLPGCLQGKQNCCDNETCFYINYTDYDIISRQYQIEAWHSKNWSL